MYNTKKAARAAGLNSADQLHRAGKQAPKRDAEPTFIRGEKFFEDWQCEDLVSRTEAKRRGLRVPERLAPHRTLHRRVGNGAKAVTYGVYRLSDLQPAR